MSALLEAYFCGIIILCAFVALAVGISHPRLRGAVNVGAGILILSAILLPLVDIIEDIGVKARDIEYTYNTEAELSDDTIEEAFELGIGEYISSKYGVDKSLVAVMVDGFELSSMRAERIYVTLSGAAAMLDYKAIEAELGRDFTKGGECEVSIKIG